jgi:hypothetical protein
MYDAIGNIDQFNVSCEQLVDVTTYIVSIILSMIISDAQKLKIVSSFVESSALLVKFAMPEKKWYAKYSK